MAEQASGRVPVAKRKASVSFRNEFNSELILVNVRGVMVQTITNFTARCSWCKELFVHASLERFKDHAREHADNGDDYVDEYDAEEVSF